MTKTFILLAVLSCPAIVRAADPPAPDNLSTARVLEMTLDALRRGEKPDALGQAKLAEQTLARIKTGYPNNVLVNDILEAVASKTDPASLREALWGVASILSFQPVMQADLPEGFPGTSTLGEIALKSYPNYRRATTVNLNESLAFFTLFAHIQKEKIAMTAPVEMNWKPAAAATKISGADTMSFLYRSQKIGEVGDSDLPGVKIVDVPAMTVVSVGLSGRPSEEQLGRYERALREWVKANRPQDAEQLGPPRVLGYNDPSMEKQYWELQLPLPPKG